MHKPNLSSNFLSIITVIKSISNGIKKVDKFHKVTIKKIPVNHPIQEQMLIVQKFKNQLPVNKDKNMIFNKIFKLTVVINLLKLKFTNNNTSNSNKNIENKHKMLKIN